MALHDHWLNRFLHQEKKPIKAKPRKPGPLTEPTAPYEEKDDDGVFRDLFHIHDLGLGAIDASGTVPLEGIQDLLFRMDEDLNNVDWSD